MIIRIMAKALVQCSTRTQAGWITLAAVAGAAGWSLTVMLDMFVSVQGVRRWGALTMKYGQSPGFVTAIPSISFTKAGHRDHKNASRAARARFAHPVKEARTPERDS